MSFSSSRRVLRGSLAVPDRNGGQGGVEIDFLFNPAELTDSHTPVYASHVVPGASHPVYQSGAGGERALSLRLFLDADLGQRRKAGTGNERFMAPAEFAPVNSISAPEIVVTTASGYASPGEVLSRNDVTYANYAELSLENDLAALRSLTYPVSRTSQTGLTSVFIPKVYFFFGNMLTGPNDSTMLECIIKKLDITINYYSPQLRPLKASVDLELAELSRRRIEADDIMTSKYMLRAPENLF